MHVLYAAVWYHLMTKRYSVSCSMYLEILGRQCVQDSWTWTTGGWCMETVGSVSVRKAVGHR